MCTHLKEKGLPYCSVDQISTYSSQAVLQTAASAGRVWTWQRRHIALKKTTTSMNKNSFNLRNSTVLQRRAGGYLRAWRSGSRCTPRGSSPRAPWGAAHRSCPPAEGRRAAALGEWGTRSSSLHTADHRQRHYTSSNTGPHQINAVFAEMISYQDLPGYWCPALYIFNVLYVRWGLFGLYWCASTGGCAGVSCLLTGTRHTRNCVQQNIYIYLWDTH